MKPRFVKNVLGWLESPLAARIVSAVSCAYFAIATLWKTGSYFDSAMTALMFFAIWRLGQMSLERKDTP